MANMPNMVALRSFPVHSVVHLIFLVLIDPCGKSAQWIPTVQWLSVKNSNTCVAREAAEREAGVRYSDYVDCHTSI